MTNTPAYKFDQKNPFYEILNNVIDPDIGIGIADMGLIYDVKRLPKKSVHVIMTFTFMGCPAAPMLTAQVEDALLRQNGVKDVQIEVVWDPPWTRERMKPEVRQMLFGNGVGK
jgi:metal-sulfur cluster biosynthetic enzyme